MSGALPFWPSVTVRCVIADSAARIADPSEVPPPVFSRPTAARAVAWSALGIAASRPPCSKAITPISTLSGCALMNACAALCAALSRLGGTSVADMLPDTSMARMTVPLACDTGTFTDGPAPANPSAAMPAMVSQMPAFLARPARPPRPPRRPARPPPRRQGAPRPAAARQRPRPRPGRRPPAGRRRAVPDGRTSCAPAPGARDDLDERGSEVRVRADAVHWHPGPAHSCGEPRVPVRDGGAEPGVQLRVAGVDDQLLSGLGVLDDDEAGLGQLV